MPSITSNKNRLGLPPFPPPEGRICIPVSVPNDPAWIGLFMGAIFRLSQQVWYDRDADHTAKDVAAVWQEIYNETTEKAWDCMGNCLCYIRRNPATGRYQYSADDIEWFEVDDGPWIDAPVIPSWPPPTPRTGSDYERRCDAAYAAALVLQSLYQKTFGVFINWANWSAFSLAQEMADWADKILGGLFNFDVLISAAQELHDNESAFQDGGFPDNIVEDVQNILYCRATVTDGVVSFDFDGVLSDFAAVGTTPYPGLNFLLQLYIGADGLNTAGSVNAGAGNCVDAPCDIPCLLYAFTISQSQHAPWTINYGTWGAGPAYLLDSVSFGPYERAQVTGVFSIPDDVTLTRVEMDVYCNSGDGDQFISLNGSSVWSHHGVIGPGFFGGDVAIVGPTTFTIVGGAYCPNGTGSTIGQMRLRFSGNPDISGAESIVPCP